MATIADLERQYYLANVTTPDAKTSNSDLERKYYIQKLGLTEPAAASSSISDLKFQAVGDTPIDVRTFGAVGNGIADDQTAIQNALNALTTGKTLSFPAGFTFNHSGVLNVMASGVTLSGGGIINATNWTNAALKVKDVNNVKVQDLTITSTAAGGRGDTWEQVGLLLHNTDGSSVSNVTIKNSSSAGLQIENASNFTITTVRCEDTRSDSIHMTGGSHHGTLNGLTVYRSGDDGVAVVSYETSPICHDITVENAQVFDNVTARGFTVIGGNNITYRHCRTERSSAGALVVACEGAPYNTHPVSNVLYEDIDIIEANTAAPTPDHGAILVHNARAVTITDVTFRNLRITDTDLQSTRQVGYIQDNAAYTIQRIWLDVATFLRGSPTLYTNLAGSAHKYTGVVIDGAGVPDHLGW